MVGRFRFLDVGILVSAATHVAVSLALHHDHRSSSNLEVATSSGTVHGFINETVPGVRAFLGIPFAQPPIGSLRFLPPVPVNDSAKTIDATQFPVSCPQFEGASPSAYTKDVRELLINGPTGEDCLALSVWAPDTPSNPSLPVYIWIYGGGYQTGGSSVPYQNPSKWIQRTQSHIVVSIQYRLNIFGFPNAAGLREQNLGFLDQRLAIQWVQANIAAFGGDPSRMVLWGQSAGASSVDIQNFAYPDDPIVSGFVMNSGSVFLTLSSADFSHSNFTAVARHFNCSTEEPEDELDCMRTIPSSAIESYLKSYSDAGTSPRIGFNPIADEVVFFSNYTQRALGGQFSDRPAIFGTVLDEGTSLTTYPENPDTAGPDPTAAKQATLALFLCPAAKSTTLRKQLGRKTYRYQYRGNFSNISPRFWLGAYHSSELPLIFGTESDARGNATAFEAAVSEKMGDLWLAFAQDPDGGLERLGWDDVTTGQAAIFAGSASGDGTGGNEEGVVLQNVTLASIDSACA